MTITAKVVLDSLAPNGARITTFELTYPRLIHADLMTHRVFSRNAASSRAIPTKKKIERIRADCAKPSEWGSNQKGMVAGGPVDAESAWAANSIWEDACYEALHYASILCGIRCATCGRIFDIKNTLGGADETDICPGGKCSPQLDGLALSAGGFDPTISRKLDLHKQVPNRILEPFDHITTVVTTTKLNNHWKLRLATDPETGRPLPDPTYYELATKWKAAFDVSVPRLLQVGEWHLPYIDLDADVTATHEWIQKDKSRQVEWWGKDITPILKKVSVGRVARTSYMRQGQGNVAENMKLHDTLAANGHWSPFEAVATPIGGIKFKTRDGSDPAVCFFCCGDLGIKFVTLDQWDRLNTPLCKKCALGHVTSGNFVGWHQYRKEFPGEDGGD